VDAALAALMASEMSGPWREIRTSKLMGAAPLTTIVSLTISSGS
jgi:hypothetical protein